jgi:large subunit ribosomal protein L25
MAALRSSSRLLFGNRLLLPTRSSTIRSLSTTDVWKDPSAYVSGLTKEEINADPQISEFLQSNFGDGKDAKDGYRIPTEVLSEYGLDDSDLVPIVENQYGTPPVDKGLGTEAQQALNIRKLSSFVRHEHGTPACDALRNDFWIPGMLYGSDPTQNIVSTDKSARIMLKTQWTELQRELDRYHRHFESRVYDLTLYGDESDSEGTTVRVLPRDVQRHPVLGKLYCANFLRYHAGRPIKIPIVYINQEESPALKRDGYIIPVNKYVECIIEDGVPIPKNLELECTGLQLKQVIKIDRLIFPDGVKPSKRVNPDTFVIGPVAGGRGGAQAAGEGEESKSKAA